MTVREFTNRLDTDFAWCLFCLGCIVCRDHDYLTLKIRT